MSKRTAPNPAIHYWTLLISRWHIGLKRTTTTQVRFEAQNESTLNLKENVAILPKAQKQGGRWFHLSYYNKGKSCESPSHRLWSKLTCESNSLDGSVSALRSHSEIPRHCQDEGPPTSCLSFSSVYLAHWPSAAAILLHHRVIFVAAPTDNIHTHVGIEWFRCNETNEY